MKKKSLLLSLFACMSAFVCAGRAVGDVSKQTADTLQAERTILEFYKEYGGKIATGKGRSLNEVIQSALTPRAIAKNERVRNETDADPVIRAQDFTDKAVATLAVRHLEGDWYMASYVDSWRKEKVEIPLKTVRKDGNYLIDYIVPMWNGVAYGDKQLCPSGAQPVAAEGTDVAARLGTMFREYVLAYGKMPADLSERLAVWRGKHLTPQAQAQFETARKEQEADGRRGYDLLIGGFDFDWRSDSTIRITGREDGLYELSYLFPNAGGEDILRSILIGLKQEDKEWKIDSIALAE